MLRIFMACIMGRWSKVLEFLSMEILVQIPKSLSSEFDQIFPIDFVDKCISQFKLVGFSIPFAISFFVLQVDCL